MAETISIRDGMEGIAVISGIGVMDYYRSLDYKEDDTFMIKRWESGWVFMGLARIISLIRILLNV